MNNVSLSEAIKAGKLPPKPIGEMTPEELEAFRNSFDPDNMGFDGHEGMLKDED